MTFSNDVGCGSHLHSVNFEYAWPVKEPSWPAPSNVGEWLSLVEHLVRDQGVGGSNPLSPTNIFNHLNKAPDIPSTPDVSKLQRSEHSAIVNGYSLQQTPR